MVRGARATTEERGRGLSAGAVHGGHRRERVRQSTLINEILSSLWPALYRRRRPRPARSHHGIDLIERLRDRPVAHRPHAAQQPGRLQGLCTVIRELFGMLPDASSAGQGRALLVQLKGAVRIVPGYGSSPSRCTSCRTVRDVRGCKAGAQRETLEIPSRQVHRECSISPSTRRCRCLKRPPHATSCARSRRRAGLHRGRTASTTLRARGAAVDAARELASAHRTHPLHPGAPTTGLALRASRSCSTCWETGSIRGRRCLI